MAYGGWANASCIAAAAGRFDAALAHADHGRAVAPEPPIIQFHMSGLRAYALACLGRHDDARAEADRTLEIAARLGSAELIAEGQHDAGLIALMGAQYARAETLLASALAAGPLIPVAEARLRRAEALARLGRPDEADAEIRAAALAPVRATHRPAVLVARMAFAQALSARARGDEALAERRLREAETHWTRLGGAAAADYMASYVDLGRPPVTGIVDPERERERVRQEAFHADLR
jgi:tetratricopeptide (TPR) repeat protein